MNITVEQQTARVPVTILGCRAIWMVPITSIWSLQRKRRSKTTRSTCSSI